MQSVSLDRREIRNVYVNNDGEYMCVTYDKNNYVMSALEDGTCELCIYVDGYITPIHTPIEVSTLESKGTIEVNETMKGGRNYKLNDDGIAFPLKTNISLDRLAKNLKSSTKRSTKNFYNYALANEWEYFVTFTFANENIRNSKELLFKSWQNFINKMRKLNNDIHAIGVYEEHEKGGYHIHSLIGNCNLHLVPGRNQKAGSEHYGEFLYTKFGDPIFNCLNWTDGLNTVVMIKPNSSNMQVVNYLLKYMKKSSCAPYGCQRFFKTNNLNNRDLICGYNDNFGEFIKNNNLQLVKKNDKMLVYRNYGTNYLETDEKAKLLLNKAEKVEQIKNANINNIDLEKALLSLQTQKNICDLEDVTDELGLIDFNVYEQMEFAFDLM